MANHLLSLTEELYSGQYDRIVFTAVVSMSGHAAQTQKAESWLVRTLHTKPEFIQSWDEGDDTLITLDPITYINEQLATSSIEFDYTALLAIVKQSSGISNSELLHKTPIDGDPAQETSTYSYVSLTEPLTAIINQSQTVIPSVLSDQEPQEARVAQSSKSNGTLVGKAYSEGRAIQRADAKGFFEYEEDIEGRVSQNSESIVALVTRKYSKAYLVQRSLVVVNLASLSPVKGENSQSTVSSALLAGKERLANETIQYSNADGDLVARIPLDSYAKQISAIHGELSTRGPFFSHVGQLTGAKGTLVGKYYAFKGISTQIAITSAKLEQEQHLESEVSQLSKVSGEFIGKVYYFIASDDDLIITSQVTATDLLVSFGELKIGSDVTQNQTSRGALSSSIGEGAFISTIVDGVTHAIVAYLPEGEFASDEDTIITNQVTSSDKLVTSGGKYPLQTTGIRTQLKIGVSHPVQENSSYSDLIKYDPILSEVGNQTSSSGELILKLAVVNHSTQTSGIDAELEAFDQMFADVGQTTSVSADLHLVVREISAHSSQTIGASALLAGTVYLASNTVQSQVAVAPLEERLYIYKHAVQLQHANAELKAKYTKLIGRAVNSQYAIGIISQNDEFLIGRSVQSQTAYGEVDSFFDKLRAHVAQSSKAHADFRQSMIGASKQKQHVLGSLDEVLEGIASQLSKAYGILRKGKDLYGDVDQLSRVYGKLRADDGLWADGSQQSSASGDLFLPPWLSVHVSQSSKIDVHLTTTKKLKSHQIQSQFIESNLDTKEYFVAHVSQRSDCYSYLELREKLEGRPVQVSHPKSDLYTGKRPVDGHSVQSTKSITKLFAKKFLEGRAKNSTNAECILTRRVHLYAEASQSSKVKTRLTSFAPIAKNLTQQTASTGQIRDSSIGWIDNPSLILYIEEN